MQPMNHVLTLVGNPAQSALDEPAAAAVQAALSAAGARVAPADWLAPGVACDLAFDGVAPGRAEDEARMALGLRPVDLAVQQVAGRRKGLLIADMDSTIITIECIDELAAFVGKKAEIAAITERAMRGELDFEQALDERIGKMRGLSRHDMERCYAERVRLSPGARVLVRTMAASGALTALVSGGFTFFTERVAAAAGFEIQRANTLVFKDDRLAGVARPILGADAKRQALEHFRAERRLALEATLAVGDGANDIPMIQAAGLGVAYHAKPKTAAAAHARVDHADLTALLYFQGYREAELVRD
jgi:phosphoserine phosphatase